jgi:hypothetical protein
LKLGNYDINEWISKPGEKLISTQMRYLIPSIEYISFINGEIELYVKIIKPDGIVLRNKETSPDRYSYSQNIKIQQGKKNTHNLSSWGNRDVSLYPPGKYFIEVYCEDYYLLYTETVEILPDIQITSLKLGNYKNKEWISKPGEKLISSQMRYLKPSIEYNSFINGKVELFIKIIQPDGKVKRNEEISPDGYSYSQNIEVLQGKEKTHSLIGWGNSAVSTYLPGKYTIEIYYLEFCLISQEVIIE